MIWIKIEQAAFWMRSLNSRWINSNWTSPPDNFGCFTYQVFISSTYFRSISITWPRIFNDFCIQTNAGGSALHSQDSACRACYVYCTTMYLIRFRAQSFTSLMADLRQELNRLSSFNRCLNVKFPWRNCSIKTFVH